MDGWQRQGRSHRLRARGAEHISLLEEFSTVKCASHFKMVKEILTKHIKNGLPVKYLAEKKLLK